MPDTLNPPDPSDQPGPVIEPVPTVFEIDRQALAKHDRIHRDLLNLQGKFDEMKNQEAKLVQDVAAAKGRRLLRPDNEDALEDLQRSAHDRSVGAFERMLTGICDDVLPQYRGERNIALSLTTDRNMPALDIMINNKGKPEKITSGAVANVVSTGLRFIALARSRASGTRPFLVLDEADCFIDGVAVENYFNVVNQLCLEAGIQALVITHHDLSSFSEEFRIYRLTDIQSQDNYPARAMDLVSAGRMGRSEMNDNPLTFIKAKNIEAFPDAGIELSPTVTVITGANQKGKSGWARMLRAAFMAKDGEAVVRHDAPTGEVCVGFGDGRVLEYQRHRKGRETAEFAMHSPQSWNERLSGVSLKDMRSEASSTRPLHHTVGAKLPEWVPGETGIYEIEGINVQMWGQFTPIFMLDAAPSARASLLSIGRESGYLHAMSEIYKDDVRADNETERKGEKEIAVIRAVTKDMANLPDLIEQMDELRESARLINEEWARISACGDLLEEIRVLREHVAQMEQQAEAAKHLLDIPSVQATSRMGDWLDQLARAKMDASNEVNFELPEMPVIAETAQAQQILEGLAQARLIEGMHVPVVPDLPEIQPTRELSNFISEMGQARQAENLHIPVVPDRPEIQPTRELFSFLTAMDQARKDLGTPVDLNIPEMPKVESTLDAATMLKALKEAAQEMLAQQAALERAQAEMAQVEKELREATEVLGNECPVCNSIMTVEMLLEKSGHSHHGHDDHGHGSACPSPVSDQRGLTDHLSVVERARQAADGSAPAPVPQEKSDPPASTPVPRLKFRRT